MTSEPITAFTSQQLAARYASHGMTPRLARCLLASAVRFGVWPDQDTTLSARWLRDLRNYLHIPVLSVLERRTSAGDGFEKFLFAAPDGARFESVLIPLAHRQ